MRRRSTGAIASQKARSRSSISSKELATPPVQVRRRSSARDRAHTPNLSRSRPRFASDAPSGTVAGLERRRLPTTDALDHARGERDELRRALSAFGDGLVAVDEAIVADVLGRASDVPAS
jgi:hypothetical protein